MFYGVFKEIRPLMFIMKMEMFLESHAFSSSSKREK